MTKQIPTEVLIQRIRDASVNGLAPSSQELSSTYKQLRKRGVEWSEACVMAGVRQRPKGRPPQAREFIWARNTVRIPAQSLSAPFGVDCPACGKAVSGYEPHVCVVGEEPAAKLAKPRRRWWQFGRAKAA